MISLRLDSGAALPGEDGLQMAASVWLPTQPESAPAVLLCLPGGNMNRGYYDLRPPDDEQNSAYNFAAQMTARGFVVAALDYLGVGDSDRPQDGWQLTPDLLTQANAHAGGELLMRLREGRLTDGLPALPTLPSIGVGHSMGAMMTLLMQAAARPHSAIALLGFSTRGLPEYVPPRVAALLKEGVDVRPRLVELAREMFREPYPAVRSVGNGAALYGSGQAERDGITALKAATGSLLAVPAFMSMLPGNVAPEAARIDVPVFLGLGEHDMAGPPQAIPAAFPGAPEVALQILPGAGHSHFLFPSRVALFERLDGWARRVVAGR